MARPKIPLQKVRSRMVGVRLREAEWAALQQLAAAHDQRPSRIIRRLIREAITAGPDYFDEGLSELREMRWELSRIGGNLNQLVRASHQGAAVAAADLRRVLNAVAVEVAGVKALYLRAELAGMGRAVVPASEDPPAPESAQAGKRK